MKLTKYGFDFLVLLEKLGKGKYTQRWLADKLSFSIGAVNKFINTFFAEGIINWEENGEMSLTDKGYEILEPFRVRRAIILAAGFSERLAPVSLKYPKPLVKINGIRLIDPLIDALLDADIKDITVVTGYKADMFESLLEKYPNLQLVNNPLYNQSQNITTLLAAQDKIDRCYICDGDTFIHNPQIIEKYEYESCFFGVPARSTNDWCFSVVGKKISNFRIGGENCHRAIFITYLNEADSAKLKTEMVKLSRTYGGLEHKWFDVLFGETAKKFTLNAKTCYHEDTTEVDTVADLAALDESYKDISL